MSNMPDQPEQSQTQPLPNGTASEGLGTEAIVPPPPMEAKLPTRKETSLKEFLNKMDDYAPIVWNSTDLYILSDLCELLQTLTY